MLTPNRLGGRAIPPAGHCFPGKLPAGRLRPGLPLARVQPWWIQFIAGSAAAGAPPGLASAPVAASAPGAGRCWQSHQLPPGQSWWCRRRHATQIMAHSYPGRRARVQRGSGRARLWSGTCPGAGSPKGAETTWSRPPSGRVAWAGVLTLLAAPVALC